MSGDQKLMPEPTDIGERLRTARAGAAMSLDEAAARTRVPARYVAAIERGDAAALPATTYGAAFVKAYARVLGIDDHAATHAFRHGIAPPVVRREHFEPAPAIAVEPSPPERARRLWPIVAALLLLAVGYGVWRVASRDEDRAAPMPRPAPRPIATPPAPRAVRPARVSAPSKLDDKKSGDTSQHDRHENAPAQDQAPRPHHASQSRAAPASAPKAKVAPPPVAAPLTAAPDIPPAAPHIVAPAAPAARTADVPAAPAPAPHPAATAPAAAPPANPPAAPAQAAPPPGGT